MTDVGTILVAAGAGLFVYTYALYPVLLKLIVAGRSTRAPFADPDEWPTVSVLLPAHNEEHRIAETLESLLSLDYPRDRIQILVVSDACTDRTDDIVRAYRDRGVELLRLPERRGKGAAETAATPHLTGEIVVNTDASIRIVPDALKLLIRRFSNSEVGLASGRAITVASGVEGANKGEVGYAGYEIAICDLETRLGSIVGASGHLYAIRHHLHRLPLPASLSRYFAAALHCRERGYQAVSVPEAICFVPRAASIRGQYRRDVRTITSGMRTLLHKRNLLNPFRYGLFAWMLFSHKVSRWLAPWAGLTAVAGLALMAPSMPLARLVLLVTAAGAITGSVGWFVSDWRSLPSFFELSTLGLVRNVAPAHALLRVMRGEVDTLEPTPRTSPGARVRA